MTHRVLAHIVPCLADRELAKGLDKLQDMLEQLQRSSDANPQSGPSDIEATLMQCARDVIVKGTAMYEVNQAAESVARGQGAASSNIRVAEWVGTLELMRREQRLLYPSEIVSNAPSIFSVDEAHTVTRATSVQRAVREREAFDFVGDDSEDDLDTDLAKAALDTGTKAFEAQEWDEADSFLQEALRVLQQLPKQRRAFCDIFGLQYKLAVCAYHNPESADAEEALMSLIQQSVSSDEQRGYIYDAAHLLSYLYIRMGQIDRARSECEKALLARRRLLGKRSDASLESTVLMAHIYNLLNNRARAKSYLAMVPEARRDAILKIVEESLGTKVEHLGSSPILTRSTSGDSDLAVERIESRLSASSLAQPITDRCYDSVSARISQSPAASLRQSHQRVPSSKADNEKLQSVEVTSLLSTEERRELGARDKDRASEQYYADRGAFGAVASSPGKPLEAIETFEIFKGRTLSRKEILDKIGCQPKGRIEDAVCDGDHLALASLLNKNRNFWQSKLRKRVRPERVTALHFAALFGEVDMARRLLGSSFNINQVPYGYSTSLTPLKFAIGARQVDMVQFLIANGAKPIEPDSWSILAGQLMNRSWLMKTMSEADKEHVPNRIIAVLKILLRHGWNVNTPFDTSGGTVLHQAVTFWTGSYRWDRNLRAAVTSFLCEWGADPFQANMEDKTPYDMASTSGHQELLLILGRGLELKELGDGIAEPAELSSELNSMV